MDLQTIAADSNADQKLKSYWNRPGGKPGIFIGIGLFCIAAYFLLPILTTIVWNSVNFGIALVVFGVLLYCLSNRKLRLSLMYLYEILMKKLVGLVIELDGRKFHSDAEALVADSEKTRYLRSLGFRVLRFTWNDVVERPEWVVSQIRKALGSF